MLHYTRRVCLSLSVCILQRILCLYTPLDEHKHSWTELGSTWFPFHWARKRRRWQRLCGSRSTRTGAVTVAVATGRSTTVASSVITAVVAAAVASYHCLLSPVHATRVRGPWTQAPVHTTWTRVSISAREHGPCSRASKTLTVNTGREHSSAYTEL